MNDQKNEHLILGIGEVLSLVWGRWKWILDHCPGNSYNLEDSLGTAQFQFGDYLYEKYLDLNAWGMDPLTGSDK